MTVEIGFDPFRLVIDAFEHLHPDAHCRLQWAEGVGGAHGCTGFPDGGGTPLVTVNIDTPIRHAVETMAHELAHVAAGHDAGHGPEWEAAFAAIHHEYNARAATLGWEE